VRFFGTDRGLIITMMSWSSPLLHSSLLLHTTMASRKIPEHVARELKRHVQKSSAKNSSKNNKNNGTNSSTSIILLACVTLTGVAAALPYGAT